MYLWRILVPLTAQHTSNLTWCDVSTNTTNISLWEFTYPLTWRQTSPLNRTCMGSIPHSQNPVLFQEMYHTACEPQLLRNNQYECHSLVAFSAHVCCTQQDSNFLWDVFNPRKNSSSSYQFGYCLQWNTMLRTFLCICELFSCKPDTSWNVYLDLHCHFL